MAIIKCPECNNDVSNTVKRCIHCGYQIQKNSFFKKAIGKKVLILFFVVCILVGLIYIFPKCVYNRAMILYENGEYVQAEKLFKHIKNYKDVSIVIEQMPYEYLIQKCIESHKSNLKNPNSVVIYEALFYLSKNTIDDTLKLCKTSETDAKRYPAVVLDLGATNGYGGMVSSYHLFLYDSKTDTYKFIGDCESISKNAYDYINDSLVEEEEIIVHEMIRSYIEENNQMGSVDIKRVNRIIQNGIM